MSETDAGAGIYKDNATTPGHANGGRLADADPSDIKAFTDTLTEALSQPAEPVVEPVVEPTPEPAEPTNG
jgi:hypothetical protein